MIARTRGKRDVKLHVEVGRRSPINQGNLQITNDEKMKMKSVSLSFLSHLSPLPLSLKRTSTAIELTPLVSISPRTEITSFHFLLQIKVLDN